MNKNFLKLVKLIESGSQDWNNILYLTDDCVDLLHKSDPLWTPDGPVYVARLPQKFKAAMLVIFSDTDSYWVLESVRCTRKGIKDLSPRQLAKILWWLIKYNFLEWANRVVFPNLRKVITPSAEEIAANTEYWKDIPYGIKPDDCIDGLEDFFREDVSEN